VTKMLASVTSKPEAMLALAADVDIIDLKNPAQGALGALPLSVIDEVVRAVAGSRQTSATIGDLPMRPEVLTNAIIKTAETGVDFIKIGFFGDGNSESCLNAIEPLIANGLRLVAVLFADRDPDLSLLPKLRSCGFYGVMLDTCIKDGRNLLDHMTFAELQLFVWLAKTNSLYCGLAGSVQITQVPKLLQLQTDYLGFRGALCINSDRKSALNESKVNELRILLHKNNTPHAELPKTQAA
jgi:uncharacterized protein (UPF0264 family)